VVATVFFSILPPTYKGSIKYSVLRHSRVVNVGLKLSAGILSDRGFFAWAARGVRKWKRALFVCGCFLASAALFVFVHSARCLRVRYAICAIYETVFLTWARAFLGSLSFFLMQILFRFVTHAIVSAQGGARGIYRIRLTINPRLLSPVVLSSPVYSFWRNNFVNLSKFALSSLSVLYKRKFCHDKRWRSGGFNNGKSCVSHDCCSVHLQNSPLQTSRCRSEGATWRVNSSCWVHNATEACTVGFLPRNIVKENLIGKFAQIMHFYHWSDNKYKRKKSHKNCGMASQHLLDYIPQQE
jgi:hypothetical protein